MNAAKLWKAKADGLLEAAAELHTEANRCLRMAKTAKSWANAEKFRPVGEYLAEGFACADDLAEIAAEPYRRVVEVFPLKRLAGQPDDAVVPLAVAGEG